MSIATARSLAEPEWNAAAGRWERRDPALERYLDGDMRPVVCACGFSAHYPPDMMTHAGTCAFWPRDESDLCCAYCQRWGEWSERGEKPLDPARKAEVYCSNECRALDEAITPDDYHPRPRS